MTYVLTIEEQLEAAILTVLGTLTGVDICDLPETEIEFNESFVKPRLYVGVFSEEPDGHLLDTNITVQMDEVTIHLLIRSRTRKGALGCFDLRRQCNALLQGFRVPGFDRLKMGRFELLHRAKGVWVYSQVIKTKVVNQQAFDDNCPDERIEGL